ncbi:hypothetical protein FXO37_15907 [Capsicum annuum]|nr:hypothetical protein FXO37_15907 [Capsicum annuum]
MYDDVDMNMGAIIFSTMRKAQFLRGCRYGFEGLLTRFFRQQGVPEEEADYLPPVGDRPLDISHTKGPTLHGVNFTMPKYQARTNEITARMYRMTILQLRTGRSPATQ